MSTSLNEDTVIIEDLDFQPQCGADNCDAEATWMAVMRCCSHSLFACDLHHDMEVKIAARLPLRTCLTCGHSFDVNKDNIIEWTKL